MQGRRDVGITLGQTIANDSGKTSILYRWGRSVRSLHSTRLVGIASEFHSSTIWTVKLRDAILNEATIDGAIVKVDGFLNHRVDPQVMASVAESIADWFRGRQPDLLLTAEASGIPPTALASQILGIPYIYAKKYVGPGQRYTFAREVSSPTKGTEYRVEVARHVLDPAMRVGIIDDFLSGGRTAAALIEIAEEAGCEVVGAAFAIEKAMGGGRTLVEEHNVEVYSVATILSIVDDIVQLAD